MIFSNQEIAEWKNILSDELKDKTDKEIANYLIDLENIVSVMDAINIVKSAGKRCGIALNPDSNIEILIKK